MKNSLCPICQCSVPFDPRYPKAVCAACIRKAVDPQGRRVVFFNTDLGGGLTGRYEDDGSEYASNRCLIDGFVCQAEERHMGGVVIQLSC